MTLEVTFQIDVARTARSSGEDVQRRVSDLVCRAVESATRAGAEGLLFGAVADIQVGEARQAQ